MELDVTASPLTAPKLAARFGAHRRCLPARRRRIPLLHHIWRVEQWGGGWGWWSSTSLLTASKLTACTEPIVLVGTMLCRVATPRLPVHHWRGCLPTLDLELVIATSPLAAGAFALPTPDLESRAVGAVEFNLSVVPPHSPHTHRSRAVGAVGAVGEGDQAM